MEYITCNDEGPGQVRVEYATEHETLFVTTPLEGEALEVDKKVWQPYFVLLNLHLEGICGTHSLHVMCVQSLKVIQYEILCIVHFGVQNECLYVL